MEPPLLRTAKLNSSQQPPIRDNVMQVVARKRIKRRVHFEEDLAVCRLATTRLQIINQSFADFVGQRQFQWCSGFRLRDFNDRIFPMKLLEFQCANVSNHAFPIDMPTREWRNLVYLYSSCDRRPPTAWRRVPVPKSTGSLHPAERALSAAPR